MRKVTIGIPAYNEEQNIKILLKRIFEQKIRGAKLTQVVVISDGSTDRTVAVCKNIKDSRLKILDHKKRLGKMTRLNELLKLTKADILILLDADVLPVGNQFIQEIINPIIRNKNIGLVGADTESIRGSSFVEKVIAISHNFKRDIYKEIENGNNIYLCHGRARAFSKKFYSQLKWPNNFPEDAYSYLTCLKNGFKFAFAPKAKVLFKSPTTLSDHFKQSARFIKGKKNLESFFSSSLVKHQYQIPKKLFIKSLVKFLIKSPLLMISYILISIFVKLISIRYNVHQSKWEISLTSKRLTAS